MKGIFMVSFKYKILGLGLAFTILSPSTAFAAEIVKYDDSDLDQVFVDNNIDYDKKAVEDRKNEYLANPNNAIAPNYEVEKVIITEELTEDDNGDIEKTVTTETHLEDTNPSPLYSKTPVYKKVVDISEHQNPKNINYDKFADDIDGAILRTSITDAKTLNIRHDYHVNKHYNELNKRNVPIGFYHYSRAINASEAVREANFVYDYIKNKNVLLPVYIDIEDDNRQAKASKGDISAAAEAFVTFMQDRGYVSGIYSYPWFANNYLTRDVKNKYEFWIADYNSKDFTSYNKSDFSSWQFTHQARVNGYNGNVDMSVHYKDYPYMKTGVSRKPMNVLVDEIIAGKWGVGAERQRRLVYAGYNYDIIQKAVNQRLANA